MIDRVDIWHKTTGAYKHIENVDFIYNSKKAIHIESGNIKMKFLKNMYALDFIHA